MDCVNLREYANDETYGVQHFGVHTKSNLAFFKFQISLVSNVVVCTDLSGKDPHIQVGVFRMVTSGSLGGVLVRVVVCTDLSGKEPTSQWGNNIKPPLVRTASQCPS